MNDFVTRLQAALGDAHQIDRELPLSGLGRVFLATETATGRQVSVQVLPPDIAGRLDTDRFRAGVDRVARLRHQGIAPILAAGSREDLVWCIWPHPRGESLRYRLVRDGGLSPAESLQVLHDLADALAYGHELGVCHGDLKPDNIYLEHGRPVIAEFGMRCALNHALGSAADAAADARADVHALAVAGQQMLAGRPGSTAGVVARALSIDPTEQYASAAAFRDALGSPPSAVRRRTWVRTAALLVVATLGAGVLIMRSRAAPALDDDLVVVAPFEILDPAHEIWREGLMTVVSANLDGAGPLRTVSPTVVVRRWEGRADHASATALARRTGARLAVFGRVVRMGGDSMRLQASLVDAEEGGTLAEMTLVDGDARLDRLGDALAVRVLRELARSRPIGAVQRASLGASSLPALKAFLEGEQAYRRSEWDRAIVAYQQAIELDPDFALALYRAGIVLGWQSTSGDSLSTAYLLRAAAHNVGLPVRDSLLVVAESLSAALDEEPPAYWALYRRAYAVTSHLVRRYPRDPEAWYEYGDIRYHYSAFSSLREIRDAFDRAIALDSAYAPAYIHPIELALQLCDFDGARRYIAAYLALDPRDIHADAVRLARDLLDPGRARGRAVQQVLDTASADLLFTAAQMFRGWPDSTETGIRLFRLLMTGRPSSVPAYADPEYFRGSLGVSLAYHGRLAEAVATAGAARPRIFASAAWMGALPRDSVARRLERSLRADPLDPGALAVLAAPWWGFVGDTASLRDLGRRADALARSSRAPLEREFARYVAGGARAFEALARGDTAAAIRDLTALPDSACEACVLYPMTLARLLDARRLDADAARLLAKDSPGFVTETDGFWELYRARLATRRGDEAAARMSWEFVRDVWLNADPTLQPFVQEARAALGRLRPRG